MSTAAIDPRDKATSRAGASLKPAPPSTPVLEAFAAALGREHVLSDERARQRAERATFHTSERVAGLLRPANAEEVRTVVQIAARHGARLHPISGGKNWGYGSRVPVVSGAFLLDLSRMDRILDFDPALGTVAVEPGVTFRALHRFLRAERAPLLAPATGGSPDASVIGNALERGIAKGPLGDRFAHVCNLEVVTGNAEIVRTGLGRFAEARAAHAYRWGRGPSLDGLFSQSHLGVVTRMSQWLAPRPEHIALLPYELPKTADLAALIDALGGLLRAGVLRPTLTLYNDARVFAATGSYPWARAREVTPLPAELSRELREERGLAGEWAGDVAILSGDPRLAEATAAIVRERLGGLVRLRDPLCADAAQIDAWLDESGATAPLASAEALRKGLLLNFLGVPSEEAVRSAYWRKRGLAPTSPLDPDRDRCGLLWVCPVVPLAGRDVVTAVRLLEEGLVRGGFEPQLTIQCMAERFAYVVASISWDRDRAGDDERAHACYREVVAALARAGFPLYRAALSAPEEAGGFGEGTASTVAALRRALDPLGVFAPPRS